MVKVGTLHPDGTFTDEKEIDPSRCPHLIMLGSHYNEDGSCKCSDASYQIQLAKWGYDTLPPQGKTGRVLCEMADGGSYAPCMYYFRIVREDLHRKAMGHIPDDYREDNALVGEPWSIVPKWHHRELSEGWTVRFLLDKDIAIAMYREE